MLAQKGIARVRIREGYISTGYLKKRPYLSVCLRVHAMEMLLHKLIFSVAGKMGARRPFIITN